MASPSASAELIAARALPAERLAQVVPDPGRPRVDEAPSVEKPHPEKTPGNRTVLQAHAAFFDFDKDGVLSLSDTFKGMRAIGFGVLLAALGTAIIHFSFSPPTTPPVELPWFPGSRRRLSLRLPDPFLRVFIANIHKGKHGSDSGTYDSEGRFVPEKLEELFSKYAGKGDGGGGPPSVSMTPAAVAKKKAAAAAASLTLDEPATAKGKEKGAAAAGSGSGSSSSSVVDVGVRDSLTWHDVRAAVAGQRSLYDPFGAIANFLEWGALFWLASQRRAADGRHVITRERARAAADGTLFGVLKVERERAAAAAAERADAKRVARAAAKAVARSRGAAQQPPSSSSSSGGGGGIPAGRRTPPPPATQVDLAPPPHPPAAKATAKKAQ